MKRKFSAPYLATLIVLGLVLGPAIPGMGQETDHGSTLNPWALSGFLFIEESPSQTSYLASLPCRAIHAAISVYNDHKPWEDDGTYDEWVSRLGTTTAEFDSLSRYFASDLYRSKLEEGETPITFDYQYDDENDAAVFCTKVHTDGWQPANASILATTPSPTK